MNGPTPMELVRYCPECGSLGDVEPGFRDCCPDGSHARQVPRVIAEQAREGFRAQLDAPAGFESWKDAAIAERVRRVKAEAAGGVNGPDGGQR